MYRSILVPIAYESGQDAAAELAAARQLASPGGHVTLVHVMEPPALLAPSYEPEGWREDLRAAILADLARLAETVPGGTALLDEGDPAERILAHAAELGADCIVLATHRMDRTLFGSTAAHVVRHAPCAVHLLR